MPKVMNLTRTNEMITNHCKKNLQQTKFSNRYEGEIL